MNMASKEQRQRDRDRLGGQLCVWDLRLRSHLLIRERRSIIAAIGQLDGNDRAFRECLVDRCELVDLEHLRTLDAWNRLNCPADEPFQPEWRRRPIPIEISGLSLDRFFASPTVGVIFRGDSLSVPSGGWWIRCKLDERDERRQDGDVYRCLILDRPAECLCVGKHLWQGSADAVVFKGEGEFPFEREEWRAICVDRLNNTDADVRSRRAKLIDEVVWAAGFTVARLCSSDGVELLLERGDDRFRVAGDDDRNAYRKLADRLGLSYLWDQGVNHA